MLKYLPLILLVGALAVTLIACANNSGNEDNTFYYSFTDSDGAVVNIKNKPEKVAVLTSSFAEVWKLAGGNVAITVKESIGRGFADPTAILVDNGAGMKIDVDALIAAKPDLVICSSNIPAQKEAAAKLRENGIATACFKLNKFSEYLDMLKACTAVTGNAEAYKKYGSDVEANISALIGLLDGCPDFRNILFLEVTPKTIRAQLPDDNFAAEILREIGAANIVNTDESFLDGVSVDKIVAADPDFIFFSCMGDGENASEFAASFIADERWNELSAVKNDRVVFLDKELFHYKPNDSWFDAYKFMVDKMYGNRSMSFDIAVAE